MWIQTLLWSHLFIALLSLDTTGYAVVYTQDVDEIWWINHWLYFQTNKLRRPLECKWVQFCDTWICVSCTKHIDIHFELWYHILKFIMLPVNIKEHKLFKEEERHWWTHKLRKYISTCKSTEINENFENIKEIISQVKQVLCHWVLRHRINRKEETPQKEHSLYMKEGQSLKEEQWSMCSRDMAPIFTCINENVYPQYIHFNW